MYRWRQGRDVGEAELAIQEVFEEQIWSRAKIVGKAHGVPKKPVRMYGEREHELAARMKEWEKKFAEFKDDQRQAINFLRMYADTPTFKKVLDTMKRSKSYRDIQRGLKGGLSMKSFRTRKLHQRESEPLKAKTFRTAR